MSHAPTEDLNVAAAEVMPPPAQIKAQIALSDEAARSVLDGRAALGRTKYTGVRSGRSKRAVT